MPQAQADFSVLVKAFDDAMPDHLANAENKMQKPEAKAQLSRNIAAGLWAPQQFAITDLVGGFCRDWTKYRGMIHKAMWIVRLVAGKQVAAAILSLVAMGDVAHKQACQVPE